MSQETFTKTLFTSEDHVIYGQMAVQDKRGLSQIDKKIIGFLLIVILSIVVLPVLCSPIIPVEVTTTETRTRNLRFTTQEYLTPYLAVDGTNITDAYGNTVHRIDHINVTNIDIEGGTFVVAMNKTLVSLVGRLYLWEPEIEVVDMITQSVFLEAGATERFNVPESWGLLNSTYNDAKLVLDVTPPTVQENYTVTHTEYRSIVAQFT